MIRIYRAVCSRVELVAVLSCRNIQSAVVQYHVAVRVYAVSALRNNSQLSSVQGEHRNIIFIDIDTVLVSSDVDSSAVYGQMHFSIKPFIV